MAPAITEYVGQRVEIVFRPEALEGEVDPVTQVTGKVENANPYGFVFKPAGSSKSRLYQADAIEDIRLAPEAEPVLKARRLDPVSLKNVKRHLVDRHGYELTAINEMSPEGALEFHEDDIDHAPLGHFHALPKTKEEKEAEKAAATTKADEQPAAQAPAPEASAEDGEQEFVFEDDSDEPDF